MIYAAAMVADSSFETFVTDAEDSDNSMQDDSNTGPTDYWTCIQCKSQNDHPQYRFCEKCFQVVISVMCAVDLHVLHLAISTSQTYFKLMTGCCKMCHLHLQS